MEDKYITINKILRNALRNTYKMYKYYSSCNEVLNNNVNDQKYKNALSEMPSIFEDYVRVPRENLSDEEIVGEALIVLDAIGETMNSAEIGEMLNIDVIVTEKALSKYSKKSSKKKE